ncbi:MAG TPA: TIGR03905 family TSCPD domain-containing protein [Clostridia bacterium]|nr:TIGR03905 family TSCPD domain-containing protein [Clostridia bacterium]
MYSFIPSGVCSRKITFDITDGKVHNIVFDGGCNGNGKGVATLAEGQPVEELIEKLSCIQCKERGTSCPAQLAKALRDAVESKQEESN